MDNKTANALVRQSFANKEQYESSDDWIYFTDTKNLLLTADKKIIVYNPEIKRFFPDRFDMEEDVLKSAKRTLAKNKIKYFAHEKLPTYIALVAMGVVIMLYVINDRAEKARRLHQYRIKNQEIMEKQRLNQIDSDTICTYQTAVDSINQSKIPQKQYN